jgi:CheY-like chemotaxis protein
MFSQELINMVGVASGRIAATALGKAATIAISHKAALSVQQAIDTGQLILLAEDNETNREVLMEQLRLLGYVAESAEDGKIALEMWRSGKYALLLTDCHMPNMDGFELTAAIRAESKNQQRTPIIAITANAMQGEAERCHERGMDDYLSKPLRLGELGPMIKKWLPNKSTLPVIPNANTPTPTTPTIQESNAENSFWSHAVLIELVGNNINLHKRLLTKFLAKAEQEIQAIAHAVTSEQLPQAGNFAHTLKSASRTAGAATLGDLCQQIESRAKENNSIECGRLIRLLKPHFLEVQAAITNFIEAH